MKNNIFYKFSITLIVFAILVITILIYNLREVSINQGINKANTISQIIQKNLTKHMVSNSIENKDDILDNMLEIDDIKNIWISRSNSIIKQYGSSFSDKYIDNLDKLTFDNEKMNYLVNETITSANLRISIPFKYNNNLDRNCKKCHIYNGELLGTVSMVVDISEFKDFSFKIAFIIIIITIILIFILIIMLNNLIKPYEYIFKKFNRNIDYASRGVYKKIIYNDKFPENSKDLLSKYNNFLNTLNDVFVEIDSKLRTFVGYSASSNNNENPLIDSKNTIVKLSYIYEFKQQIQLDNTKDEIYIRFSDILKNKFNVKYITFFEANSKNDVKKVYSIGNKEFCFKNIINDAYECRAFRSDTNISSLEFQKVCNCFQSNDKLHYCTVNEIGKNSKLIINFIFDTSVELNNFKEDLSIIKTYIKEIIPIISFYTIFQQLEDNALKDDLTGLYNRRFLDEYLSKIIPVAKREHYNIGFLMLDMDHFKAVNDEYGHDVGDKVLKAFASCIQDNIRESDIAIRFGGEEFVVLLVNIKNEEETLKIAEKLRHRVSLLEIEAYAGSTIRKTVSIGVSIYPKDSRSVTKIMKQADLALYNAKNNGRDSVVRYKENNENNVELF